MAFSKCTQQWVPCDMCGAQGVPRVDDGGASMCGACKKTDAFELRLVLPEHCPSIGGCRDSSICICTNFTDSDIVIICPFLRTIRMGGMMNSFGCVHEARSLCDFPVYLGKCRKRGYVWKSDDERFEVTLRSKVSGFESVAGVETSIQFTVGRDQLDWVTEGETITIGIFDSSYYSNRCVECGCGLGIMNPRQLCGKYMCHNESEISPPSVYAHLTGVVCERSDKVFGVQFLHVREEVNIAVVLANTQVDSESDSDDEDAAVSPLSLLHRRIAFTLELTCNGLLNPVVTPPVESCYVVVLAAARHLRFTPERIPRTVWDRIFWWAAEFLLDNSPEADCVLLRGAPIITRKKRQIEDAGGAASEPQRLKLSTE